MATYTKTVDPNGGADYASLSAWEAGQQTLYSSGDIAIADCKRTGATKDTTAVTIAGWTAGVVPKIIVNAAHRHEGKWADQQASGNYIYVLSVSSTGAALDLSTAGNEVYGLLFEKKSTSFYYSTGISIGAIANTRISGCIGKNASTGSTDYRGIWGDVGNTGTLVDNTIVFGWNTSGINGQAANDDDFKIYNCTAYNCGIGIKSSTYRDTSIKNTLALNCTTCFSTWFGTSSDYNISSDATAPGTNKATGKTAYTDYFVDPANGDFHLKDTSLALFGLSGTDLSGTFTDDIDGVTRSAPWDIGADQYVAGGGAALLEGILFGSSTTSAALTTAITMAAQSSGSATASANLTTSIALAAQILATGTTAGDLTTAISLGGTAQGTAAVTAQLTTAIRMAAVAAGVGSLSGDLAGAVAAAILVGTVAGSSSVDADLLTAIPLSGSALGNGATQAQLSTAITLAAAAQGDSAAQAALATAISLSAQVNGTSSVQGVLDGALAVLGFGFILPSEIKGHALPRETRGFNLPAEAKGFYA